MPLLKGGIIWLNFSKRWTAASQKLSLIHISLILLLVGLIYIIETLSVILQVTYFKATHGKRLFKICLLYTSRCV